MATRMTASRSRTRKQQQEKPPSQRARSNMLRACHVFKEEMLSSDMEHFDKRSWNLYNKYIEWIETGHPEGDRIVSCFQPIRVWRKWRHKYGRE